MEKKAEDMQMQLRNNKENTEKIRKERVALFIDGSNFYHSIKRILKPNEKVEYKTLVNLLAENKELVVCLYYVAILDKERDYKRYEKHLKFLSEIGKIPKFKVILCNLKKIEQKDGTFTYIVKGDDIKLAHDLLVGAFYDRYDTAIIVSGDEDFLPLIGTVRNLFKKKVGNAYFRFSSSFKLRKACNYSINLNKLVKRFIIKKNK